MHFTLFVIQQILPWELTIKACNLANTYLYTSNSKSDAMNCSAIAGPKWSSMYGVPYYHFEWNNSIGITFLIPFICILGFLFLGQRNSVFSTQVGRNHSNLSWGQCLHCNPLLMECQLLNFSLGLYSSQWLHYSCPQFTPKQCSWPESNTFLFIPQVLYGINLWSYLVGNK